jgi:hypothetical protein
VRAYGQLPDLCRDLVVEHGPLPYSALPGAVMEDMGGLSWSPRVYAFGTVPNRRNRPK